MRGHQISKSEFKAKALEFFRLIESTGESVIVTDHGKPALEVRRYRGAQRRPLEILHGSPVWLKNPTEHTSVDEWESAQ
jgi:hypothetical protein